MRLVQRESGSHCPVGEEAEVLPAIRWAPTERRVPSVIQSLLTSRPALPSEDMVTLVRARAPEAEAPVWPVTPSNGACEEYAPVLESPGARKRLKREIEFGRMSSPVMGGDRVRQLEGTLQRDEEEDEDDSGGRWMPAGDGSCRTSDAHVYFAVTQASLPSDYCRVAFPCTSGFAPCVPVGHVARGKLELSQGAGRFSFLLDLEIFNGGCRPLYVVTVSSASGERVLRRRHSQPAMVLQMVLTALADEAVPRLTDDVTATFFGLDLPNVRRELERGWARRQQAVAKQK